MQIEDPKIIKKFVLFWLLAFGVAIGLLVFFRSLLISLILSGFIAYLLGPMVGWLSKKILGNRQLSSVIMTFALFGMVVALLASVTPYIYSQAAGLARLLPGAVENTLAKIDPLKSWLIEEGVVGRNTLDSLVENLSIVDEMGQQVRRTVEKIWQSTPKLFSGVIDLLLVPVMTFFILFEMDRIKLIGFDLIPYAIREEFIKYLKRIDLTLKGVLKGQVMVAGSLALLYSIGLWLVGLQFGVVVGVIAGCFRVVPYLDVVVGLLLSLAVIIGEGSSFGVAVAVIVVFVAVQAIDGMVITPRIIGGKAGLHPGLVIVSVFAFTDWFGVFGVFIVIPLLAVLKVSGELFIEQYKRSQFFIGDS